MLTLTILGNNSAIPAFGRNPTSQVLQTQEESYLIDCGEGTQSQLSKYKIKRSRIRHIFISHLHGDHYFGLIGLITSMGLLNRIQDLHIHGPALLEDIINIQLKAADTELPYQIYFHAINEEKIIADTPFISVKAFRVRHRIDCWGFLFTEKKNKRKIDADKLKSYEIPSEFYTNLQKGDDYITAKGTIIPNEEVTFASTPPRSYAYCSDTIYHEEIIEHIKNADLLYHETTYLKDLEERAAARFHSTTIQAAQIARLANAGRLIIGHFSSKYEVLDEFLSEAKEVFEETELALEGVCFKI
jgi:ribonuclease Z